MTKTELERAVADAAGVEKRTAAAVLDALQDVVTNKVRKGEPVTIRPGFIKVSRKDVKARKAREGTNPFTGEPTVFKARPASKTAKVTALAATKMKMSRLNLAFIESAPPNAAKPTPRVVGQLQ